MSVTSAAVFTGRSATVLERDEDLFRAATSSLLLVANSKILDEQIGRNTWENVKRAQSLYRAYDAELVSHFSAHASHADSEERDIEDKLVGTGKDEHRLKTSRLSSVSTTESESGTCSAANRSSLHVHKCPLLPHAATG